MDGAREPVGRELASAASAVAGMGGVATAAAVSACCAGPALGPLVIALLGAGGAVALEGLRPYMVPLLVVSGLAIGVSFWLNARSVPACSPQRSWALVRFSSRLLTWASAFVWLGAVAAVLWARFA
jgi:hypothetical protein